LSSRAFTSPRTTRPVFSLVLSGSIQLCITADIYAEHEEVIRRPRFSHDENVIAAAPTAIRERASGSSPPRPLGRAPIRMTTSSSSVLKLPARPIG
jgi:hypothetical protein